MKIITYNVNGIRAAYTKNFIGWLRMADPDVICIQESKAGTDQIDVESLRAAGYHSVWHSAQRKGYSGVGIASKATPSQIIMGCGIEHYDSEGRILRADFDDLTVISVYVPSASNIERLVYKLEFCNDFLFYIKKLREKRPQLIVSGDFNICHQERDIHNPNGLENVSGFLPEERAWMSAFLQECGLIDTFRLFNQEAGHYTWWSYRQNARANNKGWRLDYHFATEELLPRIRRTVILPEVYHSDHCPVLLELA